MPDKSLKDKAVKIKDKDYVLVSDRVIYFNTTFDAGCIVTNLEKWEGETIIMKAVVYPEGLTGRYFTGYAQETVGDGYINKTSALENAETSAVGRALAMMGIGVIDSIASVDEINKAENTAKTSKPFTPKLDPTAPRKVCEVCTKEFNPKPGTEHFATRCYPCYKEHGKEPAGAMLDNQEVDSSEIPF